MTFKIVISDEAKEDIKEAKAFYSEINAKLGKNLAMQLFQLSIV